MSEGRDTVRIQCFHLPNTSTHTTRHDSFNHSLQYGCVGVGWGGGGIKERVVWVNEGCGMVRVQGVWQCGGDEGGGVRGELRKGWCE